MSASTRRAAIGAILAAPLASVPAAANFPGSGKLPAVSPELVRLIAKHDRINERLNASSYETSCNHGLVRAAGAMRARVAGFPSHGLPDILAKAECLARLYPLADAEHEVREEIASGHAYLDCMALNIAIEVMKLGEGTLCA